MTKVPVFFLAITSIVLSALGCDSNKTESTNVQAANTDSFDLTSVKKIITEKNNRFTQAHITKDTAFLNNIFTRDARTYPPNADLVTGRAAIAAVNTAWVNYGIKEFTETSISFYGNKEFLIDEGTYYLRFGENNTIDKGKYVNIWKMEDGDWKICSNIWNTSLPDASQGN